MPGFSRGVAHLLNPLDSVRYTEVAFLLDFFGGGPAGLKVLDVSSPHALAYLLSRRNSVIKTNIDEAERAFIREDASLRFRREDALKLSFADETFDLTCSVSVVEHIYLRYAEALREMLRVTKKGGCVYLTFPVAAERVEEWLPYPMYPAQEKAGQGYFFQYRFSKSDVDAMLAAAGAGEAEAAAVYWERTPGAYDRLTTAMRKDLGAWPLNLLRNAALNLWSGFFLLQNRPGGFNGGGAFGNMSVIIRKGGAQ